jgi:three-Cys-motif partner protein
MPKDINSEEYDAGTKVKLEILSSYIGEWLQVMINLDYLKTFYLYDFFAGSGSDTSDNPGSPIIILNHVITNCPKLKEKNKNVSIVFNDNNSLKIEKLKQKCNELIKKNCTESKSCTGYSENRCPIMDVRFENKDFKNLFNEEYKKLRSKTNPYCFMFIDQYGLKEVDISTFNILSSLKHTDILFFTATAHAVRFSKTENIQKHLNIGDDFDWSEKSHRELCKHYSSLIPKSSSFRVAPFSIKKEDTGMICGLIFGSSNLYGIEKFLTVAWEKDSLSGEANYDIEDDDMRPNESFLFEDIFKPKKLDRFEKNLKEYLQTERTNNEIYEFTLSEGFLPKHVTQILKALEKDNKLSITAINGETRKSAYYINHSESEKVRILYEHHKN